MITLQLKEIKLLHIFNHDKIIVFINITLQTLLKYKRSR